MKSSTSFGFSSSLLFFFFIVASIAVYSEAGGHCRYSLIFKTGTVAEAGTDSRIGVKFGNFGDSIEIPDLQEYDGNRREYFKSGNEDTFSISSACLSPPVCTITVTSDGGGQKPRWYLEYVRVITLRLNGLLSPRTETKFEFNEWLAIDEPSYELTASREVCEFSSVLPVPKK